MRQSARPRKRRTAPAITTTDAVGIRVDGVLLAGGKSRRFGRDKRRERLGDRSLAEHALGLLRGCVDGCVFLAGRGGFDHPVGATFVVDAAPGAGPLGGLVAALALSRFGVLVLPCDVPLLRADTLAAVARLGRRRARTVVVRSPRGLEPLIAFYPRTALPILAAGLREGNRALHRLLTALAPLEIPVGESRELHNVNRPADLEFATAWRARPAHEGPKA